ncbi:MAG: hypothetical protein ACR2P1_12120 [Pseudomonadales bacterium]
MKSEANWILWSSKLSPFGLKVDALLRQAGMPFNWFPEESGFLTAAKGLLRVKALQSGRLSMTWPRENKLQELPAVPYLLGSAGENLYDSSAIGEWLTDQDSNLTLLPAKNTAEGFFIRLIDEALDEFGLYMVHHNRWVHAATDNTAGERLAAEMKPMFGPARFILGKLFPARQTRRLPYLFSVASSDCDYSHLPAKLQPPSRPGFPPTHKLLDEAFRQLLAALELIFSHRPYLLGSRMSLADASILGQLGMNKTDPAAWKIIRAQAPNTALWIDRHYLKNVKTTSTDNPALVDDLQPLLLWCCQYFVPLMQQNCRAYQYYKSSGETLFNEPAFNRHRSLYQGQIAGTPFKNVAKTFQVLVWENLHSIWQQLPWSEKEKLEALLPLEHGLGGLLGPTEITIDVTVS